MSTLQWDYRPFSGTINPSAGLSTLDQPRGPFWAQQSCLWKGLKLINNENEVSNLVKYTERFLENNEFLMF